MRNKCAFTVAVALVCVRALVAEAATLQGRVLDENGAPLDRGQVGLVPLSEEPLSLGRAVSDLVSALFSRHDRSYAVNGDGAYVARGIEPGAHLLLVVAGGQQGKRQLCHKSLVTVAPDQRTLDIRVTRGGLSATVRDPDHEPVPNIYVEIVPTAVPEAYRPFLEERVRTDEHGMLRIWPLAPGTYEVRIDRRRLNQAARVRIAIAEAEVQTDIVLLGPGRVTGKVSAPGSQVERTAIFLSCEDPLAKSVAFVRADGTYDTGCDLIPGLWQAFVVLDGHAIETAELRMPQDAVLNTTLVPCGDLKVALTGKSTVITGKTVRVRREDGTEVLRARLRPYLAFVSLRWQMAPTSIKGETIVYGLRPGKYSVNVDGSKGVAFVSVAGGKTATATLAVE